MTLNKKEMALGAGFGAALSFFVGPIFGLTSTCACAFLWAFGGSGAGRVYRYAGVPLVTLAVLSIAKSPGGQITPLVAIGSTFAACLILSMGYGIPTLQPPDEGSTLGRFVYKLALRHVSAQGHTEASYTDLLERVSTLIVRLGLSAGLALAYLPLLWAAPAAYGLFFATVVGLHYLAIQKIEGDLKLF